MKASETSPRYIGKVRECCNYAARSAKNFIQNADAEHRQTGGNGEAQLRDMLQKDLNGFCDEVSAESFKTNQKAYFVSNLLTFFFMLLSAALAILAFFTNDMVVIAAFVFALLSLLAFFGIFGGTSKDIVTENLYAVRRPENTLRHRILLEANLDAPYKRRLSRKTEVLMKLFSFVGILLYLAYDILVLLINNGTVSFSGDTKFLYVSFVLALFIAFPLILTRTVSVSTSTPGVADNLAGAYTACGAMRYLSEMDLRLPGTEFDVLLTSGKADRNRGAHAFIKSHADELSETDTLVICLDSIYNPDTLNAVVKGRKVSKLVDAAAANGEVMLTDHNPKYHKGDFRAFAKAGISTVSLTTLPDEMPKFYRAEADNTDNLNVHAIEAAIKVCLEAAYLKDAEK